MVHSVSDKTILAVDDDDDLLAMVRTYLTQEGFDVVTAGSVRETMRQLSASSVSLLLLDLNIGGDDGLSLLRELRQTSDLPVIILTGKSDPVDRIVGLEVGADDYVVKPFHLRELLARIRTVLRRTEAASGSSTDRPAVDAHPARLRFAGWTLDLQARSLSSIEGFAVDLTTMEFDLLSALATRPNRALTRDQLLDIVTGRESGPLDRTIDVHIASLRRKIEADPRNPTLIKTLRGTGYIFAAKAETTQH